MPGLDQPADAAEQMLLNATGDKIPVKLAVLSISWKREEAFLVAFIDIADQKALLREQEGLLAEEQRLNRLLVGRELRMIELKREGGPDQPPTVTTASTSASNNRSSRQTTL